jgi:polar amino acid transport system substrate-binding protein
MIYGFSLLALLFAGATAVTADESLIYVTETYPPYNFSDNKILCGIAFGLLVVASQQTTAPIQPSQIRLMPWARSYRTARKNPNHVRLSSTRTPERKAD